MSILFQLKKIFDPTKHREEKEDLENNRVDRPTGLAEGDGMELDLPPEKSATTYECQHCGFTSEKKNYCGDCLTFMQEVRG